MAATPTVPAELLDPVVAYFNPRWVVPRPAGPGSDIDLLVVDDDTPPDRLTLFAGHAYHQATASWRT